MKISSTLESNSILDINKNSIPRANMMVFFYERPQKPRIGFEPMTYALPWRYSTTELKGPIYFRFKIDNYIIYS